MLVWLDQVGVKLTLKAVAIYSDEGLELEPASLCRQSRFRSALKDRM